MKTRWQIFKEKCESRGYSISFRWQSDLPKNIAYSNIACYHVNKGDTSFLILVETESDSDGFEVFIQSPGVRYDETIEAFELLLGFIS